MRHPVLSINDLPENVAQLYLITVQNRFGQLSITTAFVSTRWCEGNKNWHVTDWLYAADQKNDDHDYTLSDAWTVIAWAYMPEPYNPYKADIRHIVRRIKGLCDREQLPKDTRRELIGAIEDSVLYDTPQGDFYRAYGRDQDDE